MNVYWFTDLSIDAMDVAGEQQFDVMHNMAKQRLNNEGQPIKEEQEGLCFCLLFSVQIIIFANNKMQSLHTQSRLHYSNKT